jgi:hypothetical protein
MSAREDGVRAGMRRRAVARAQRHEQPAGEHAALRRGSGDADDGARNEK